MMHYLAWSMDMLSFQVGDQQRDGSRIARNAEGFVSYGPHCRLAEGRYFAGFYIRGLTETEDSDLFTFDICRSGGRDVIAARSFSGPEMLLQIAGLTGVDFELEDDAPDLEFRLWTTKRAAVEVRGLVIFRNEPL